MQKQNLFKKVRAVFLDRDGVINKKMADGDYVKKWSEFQFLPGAIEALRLLTQSGFEIFVVTNQRGIARGLMSKVDVEDIHSRMCEELRKNGVGVRAVYYCPHGYNECECRKPKPGMILCAARDYGLDLREAVMIGDDEKDAQAARVAGTKPILIKEGELLNAAKKLIHN